jgi:hypothetical protein
MLATMPLVHSHLPLSTLSALTLALVAGCDPAASPAAADTIEFRDCPDTQTFPCKVGCPCTWNGPWLSYGMFTSIDVTGKFFLDKTLNHIALAGAPITDFSAPGGLPTGTYKGQVVSGAAMIGMSLVVSEGTRYATYTLTDIELGEGTSPVHRLWFEDEVHQPVCTDADANPMPVILLEDMYWDTTGTRQDRPDTLTFACERGALGKAMHEWGYSAYDPALAPYHQTATRMLRADYCGTGGTWATEGTAIVGADTYTLHPDPIGGVLEAVWNEDGPVCLGKSHRSQHSRAYIDQVCGPIPYCDDNLELDDIAALGGLMLSRIAP